MVLLGFVAQRNGVFQCEQKTSIFVTFVMPRIAVRCLILKVRPNFAKPLQRVQTGSEMGAAGARTSAKIASRVGNCEVLQVGCKWLVSAM